MKPFKLKPVTPLIVPVVLFQAAAFLTLKVWEDLAVNLIADSWALCFGLFIFDRMAQRERDRVARPTVEAAWRTLHRIHEKLAHFVRACLEDSWHMQHVADLKAALEAQDSRYLALALSELQIDLTEGEKRENPAKRADGRRSIDVWLKPALSEADRFLGRYIGFVDPPIVELVERLETCSFVSQVANKSYAISAAGTPVWFELLAIEHEFRTLMGQAKASGLVSSAEEIVPVAPGASEWLKAGSGWTGAALRDLQVERSPMSRLDEYRRGPPRPF